MNPPRCPRFSALFGAFALVASSSALLAQEPAEEAQEPKVLDSIRYLERPDGSGELLTGITSFKNDKGQVVDLVGVIHIADAAYYRQMNQLLSGYDVVLYEMVGGPVDQRVASDNPEIALTHVFQRIVQSILGLRYQLDGIDYTPKNFVHADATWEQWDELMAARNESMLTFFAKAMELENSEEMQKHFGGKDAEELMTELGASIMEFNPEKFKRSVAPLLAEAETMVDLIEGDEGSVIISERNKIVLKAVEEQIDNGHKRIAVFYGAGHNPDLAERLDVAGFTEGDTQWMTAWNVSNSDKPMDGLDLVETLLKDDQVISGIMSFLRGMSAQSGN